MNEDRTAKLDAGQRQLDSLRPVTLEIETKGEARRPNLEFALYAVIGLRVLSLDLGEEICESRHGP